MFYIRLFVIGVEWKPFERENVFKRKNALLNQKNKGNLHTFVLHNWSFVSSFTFLVRADISPTRNSGSQGREKGKRLLPIIIHLDVTKRAFMCQVVPRGWHNLALLCIATRLSPHFSKTIPVTGMVSTHKVTALFTVLHKNTDFKSLDSAQNRTD